MAASKLAEGKRQQAAALQSRASVRQKATWPPHMDILLV